MLTISSPVENAERLAASVAEHRAIVDAIAARDPERARRAMEAVVQKGIDRAR